MLHTTFSEIRPAGSRVDFFLKGYIPYTIYGHGGHLGHVTSNILINFLFHVPKSFVLNLVKNGLVVSEKCKF